jgi:hypothetical protein
MSIGVGSKIIFYPNLDVEIKGVWGEQQDKIQIGIQWKSHEISAISSYFNSRLSVPPERYIPTYKALLRVP